MKRFQRVSAFVLVLAMVLGMIPGGILNLKADAAEPASEVGKTYLHASYIAAGAKVDGAQDAGYRLMSL